MIAGLNVLWPRNVASHIVKPGAVDVDTAARVYHALASSFPPAWESPLSLRSLSRAHKRMVRRSRAFIGIEDELWNFGGFALE